MGIGPCIIEENGECYITIGTVAKIVGRSVQTIRLWDNWSDDLEANGSDRLIPASRRVGKNKTRCWPMSEVTLIEVFSKNIQYGDIAQFSRTRWGEKSNNLKQDRSTEARKQREDYRKKVNTDGKKNQKQKRTEEIKREKGNMIKAIRKKARKIYDEINYDN